MKIKKPPTEEIGALHQLANETGSAGSSSAATNSSLIPKTNGNDDNNGGISERIENSKSPISVSTYRETSATPSSNYQDSETTYYELCPHEFRIDHENDDQIVIQNLCNRKHEKLNKPCQNGFCYCFTSDSDEVRFTTNNNKTNPKIRHKPRKHHHQQQQQSTINNNNPTVSGIGTATAAASSITASRNKFISRLAAKTQNISPPMTISSTSQDGESNIIEQTTINSSGSHPRNNTIVKSHRILKSHLNSSPSIVKSRLRETFDSDPNAPLVRIIQEIHKNVVISEVRINRDKIKCTRHSMTKQNHGIDGDVSCIESSGEGIQRTTGGKFEMFCKEKKPTSVTTKIPKFADKKTQTDSYLGRDSDYSRSSSRGSGGGRLLLKRIGSDAALKLKNSQDPPRKPPRRRFSNSSRSTKFTATTDTTTSPIVVHEKTTSPINTKYLDSINCIKEKQQQQQEFHKIDDDEKYKKNPYTKLREALPSEKEIITEEIKHTNYQKASPSCPTLSELSSPNTTIISPNSDNGGYISVLDKDDASIKMSSSCTENGTNPNIGWVSPHIVNMIHYEARGKEKDFHTTKTQPEPQKNLQQQMGWTIPTKRDIDTVDNVKLRRESVNAECTTSATGTAVVEEEFNNFASSMESKSTPVKTQILSQSMLGGNKSFIKDKLSNKISTNLKRIEDDEDCYEKSLEQNASIPFTQNKEKDKVIKTTTFRKRATQNTRNFFENSKKKFVRFVFGGANKNFNNINNNGGGSSNDNDNDDHKTVATQTFESELMSLKSTSAIPNITISAPNTTIFKHFTQKSSIYPSIGTDPNDSFVQEPQQKQQQIPIMSTQPSSSVLSSVDNFDFSRKIDSPKKPDRTSQRKLKFSPRKAFKNFGSGSGSGSSSNKLSTNDKQSPPLESYKSYDSDFINSDFRIAAMNDILASLRSKIETNDDELPVQKLYQNTETAESLETDTIHEDPCETCSSLNKTLQISARADIHSEPIYSEIEDHQQQQQQQQQQQKVEHHVISDDPNAIYAQVQKVLKNDHVEQHTTRQISNLEHHHCQVPSSSRNENDTQNLSQQQSQQFGHPSQCHKNQVTSKTDGSANSPNPILYQGTSGHHDHQEHDDVVSYDEPDETSSHRPEFDQNSYCIELDAGGDKQQRKIDELKIFKSKLGENISQISDKSFRCTSCPLPRSKYENLLINNNIDYEKRNVESENNFPTHNNNNNNNNNNDTSKTISKRQNLRDRLKLSFRKGTKKLTNVKNLLKRNDSQRINDKIWEQSDLCISKLYASEILNENYGGRGTDGSDGSDDDDNDDNCDNNNHRKKSVAHRIEKAVSICRQMPQFESSTELVEAERLLLYASLKRELQDLRKYQPPPSILSIPPVPSPSAPNSSSSRNNSKCQIHIDSFEIPIKSDGNHDMFFNYFYIGVFVNGNVIKSTQSVEKRNNTVIFSNCNIFFDNLESNFGIRCYIYVLRLRKLCNFIATQTQIQQPPKRPQRKITNNNSSDSGDELISRFRLQGSFVIIAPNFAPYQICEDYNNYQIISSIQNENENLNNNKNRIHLNSFSTCIVPLTTMTRTTNLCKEVKITANIELVFKKFELKGFLNVEDNNKRHNWNQRWCQLDTLKLLFWDYPQDCNIKEPILIINLIKCISYPIEIANREVCARPKSFSIQISNINYDDHNDNNENDDNDRKLETYFLSTDNQTDLNYWINGLNEIIEFVRLWMC